tara:strand:- start:6797 stop:8119 length:1323 start_codon:yes stop_codon:yes gene_type:complete
MVSTYTLSKLKQAGDTSVSMNSAFLQREVCTDAASKVFSPRFEVQNASAADTSGPVHPPSPPATPEEIVTPKAVLQAKNSGAKSWQQLRDKHNKTYAPIYPNRDCEHEYAPYDEYSVPILQSALIKRQEATDVLLNNPSIELKQAALALLECGLKAHHIGRPDVAKSGPTRVIDDCDLYFRDGMIHVASERGTLLAATYLKLLGIADTTPVRFNGLQPAWVKRSLAQRHLRRVEVPTEWDDPWYTLDPEKPMEAKPLLEPLRPGELGLDASCIVEIFERHPQGTCYGRRSDNGKVGWFEYENTVGLDEHNDFRGVFEPKNFYEIPPAWRHGRTATTQPGRLDTSLVPSEIATTSLVKSAPRGQSGFEKLPIKTSDVGKQVTKAVETDTKLEEHEAPKNTPEVFTKEDDMAVPLQVKQTQASPPAPYGAVEDEVDWDDDEL